MAHSKLSPNFSRHLAQQLSILEEEKILFLDTYFPMQGNERANMNLLLTDYIQTLKSILAQSKNDPAVVLIGSEVSLTYLDEQSQDTLTIVFPHETRPDQQQISFLSPIGKQLLMKRTGDVIDIEIPSGHLKVRIDHIQYTIPSPSSHEQKILQA